VDFYYIKIRTGFVITSDSVAMKGLPTNDLSTVHDKVTGLGSNPGLRDEVPLTNRPKKHGLTNLPCNSDVSFI